MAPSADLWPLLVVTSGPPRGRSFSIPPGRSTLGRNPNADIVVPNETVSSRHAQLERSGDRVHIQDLNSTNGTRLNKTYLAGTAQLNAGDAIQLGDIMLSFVPGTSAALTELETALTAPDDQRDAAAQHLHSFATGLKEAGAMASASTSVVESVGKIASWLGPLGASILALL